MSTPKKCEARQRRQEEEKPASAAEEVVGHHPDLRETLRKRETERAIHELLGSPPLLIEAQGFSGENINCERRISRDFELPKGPPQSVAEARRRIQDAIARRELAIRDVDELHQMEKRLRQNELRIELGGGDKLAEEKTKREIAEKKVIALLEENRKLRDTIRVLTSSNFSM